MRVVRFLPNHGMRWIREPRHALLVVLALCGIVGAAVVSDYGLSWDEPLNIRYARVALDAYLATPHFNQVSPAGPTGPGYFMLVEVGSKVLGYLTPFWLRFETRHYLYFLTFLLGAWGVYDIARRVSGEPAAVFSSVLYLLQPLLWGHAFMNPKDTPFMSLIVLTVASGMRMVDSSTVEDPVRPETGRDPNLSPPGLLEQAQADWVHLTSARRLTVLVTLAVFVIIVLDLVVFHVIVLPLTLRGVNAGLAGSGPAWLIAVADRFVPALGRASLVEYLWKATRIYWRLRLPAVFLVIVALVGVLAKSFTSAWARLSESPAWKKLIIASLLLGLASSTRVIGTFAGILVTCYALLLWKGVRFRNLAAYWILAGGVGLALRPYFWTDPVRRLWTSLTAASDFTWQGVVLFRGETFHIWELPPQYSPALLLQQLTIPAIVLGGFGLLALFLRRSAQVHAKKVGSMLVLWTAVPLIVIELAGISSYDRYRQLLFILPPLFIFAGSSVDEILSRFRSPLTLPAIGVISLLPAIIAIIGLHPYEYIYINSLAGGIHSNFRRSEMDYWCLSVREGVEFVNQNAPPQNSVLVYGQAGAAQSVLRSDLSLVSPGAAGSSADYAIICTRSNQDLRIHPEAETVFEVNREGAVLTVVKELQ